MGTLFQSKYIYPLIFIASTFYVCFYIWTAIALLFHPIRSAENIITSHLEVIVGDNAKSTQLILDTESCSFTSERKVIPAPNGSGPFDVLTSFNTAINSENPPHISKHETSPNIPLIFTFELPTKDLSPGRYIWVDKTSYYCNVFNYIIGPYIDYTYPQFVIINSKTN